MNRIRFQMTPPPGAAARLAEKEEKLPQMPRVAGGDAARLHEERERSHPSARMPSGVGFSLRAQGGRVMRSDLPAAPNVQPAAPFVTADVSIAAQTAEADNDVSPASQPVHRHLLSLVRHVEALLRRI